MDWVVEINKESGEKTDASDKRKRNPAGRKSRQEGAWLFAFYCVDDLFERLRE